MRVIGECAARGRRTAGLDDHALARRGRDIKPVQRLFRGSGLTRVVLRHTLRAQQLPGQEGHADQGEPADDRGLGVACAPARDALDERAVLAAHTHWSSRSLARRRKVTGRIRLSDSESETAASPQARGERTNRSTLASGSSHVTALKSAYVPWEVRIGLSAIAPGPVAAGVGGWRR